MTELFCVLKEWENAIFVLFLICGLDQLSELIKVLNAI